MSLKFNFYVFFLPLSGKKMASRAAVTVRPGLSGSECTKEGGSASSIGNTVTIKGRSVYSAAEVAGVDCRRISLMMRVKFD